ncbi:SRPBCC family protein [Hoyosella subflava]|uniref:Dimethyladenosine transferase (RRNA methylation) n=1 Tax=Hoyosella subflava (strain DSM 45089 / JCM 17490 / NBRC 109087 / DQS3-9A1) TaxID=443218 RepID=F6EPN6_HOYSD|nr:SRPBCC family protein [Hoyosella subflava]AEF40515.1 Dimethyladenosine transferase (RRNA methylation) [Hoyosella subflava DQS3-9A1]
MKGNTLSVRRTIPVEPEKIFALLADAAKHREFDGSGTVVGTRAESRPLALGTKFGMSMKMGLPYSMANVVIEYEPDRRIAWKTTGLGGLLGGRIWRYELERIDGGTAVTETWDLSEDKQRFFLKRSKFPAATRTNMARTLERIEEAVAR